MHIVLESKLFKSLAGKILKKVLFKKLGLDLNFKIDNFEFTPSTVSGESNFCLSVSGTVKNDSLEKLIDGM